MLWTAAAAAHSHHWNLLLEINGMDICHRNDGVWHFAGVSWGHECRVLLKGPALYLRGIVMRENKRGALRM